ncbi:Flp family type IVb pilin [Pacificimonas sp. WHA3]|uniref:Flp family type IVb pilin n=1 Tax=Pacificimonas pallii TaxID=2827236 RepID=A0ABS6SIR9_9SPHN|nr:Flp family type IVb pilin [Pacificimonas pallii]MBV7257831.1 Flp family type IVb pilin [Pacificimonas pallii]
MICKIIHRIRRNDDGATAIEYGLLAALIAVAALGGFQAFGTSLTNMWGKVSSTSQDVMS